MINKIAIIEGDVFDDGMEDLTGYFTDGIKERFPNAEIRIFDRLYKEFDKKVMDFIDYQPEVIAFWTANTASEDSSSLVKNLSSINLNSVKHIVHTTEGNNDGVGNIQGANELLKRYIKKGVHWHGGAWFFFDYLEEHQGS